MKKITKYQALDGKVFNTETECLDYEIIVEKVEVIMKHFGKRPDDINFSNGGGFIQHEKAYVERAKTEITALGNKLFNANADFGFIGRYFDDSGYDCLYSAWGRLSAVDNKNREWGQTYYAIHPELGKQIEFKKR